MITQLVGLAMLAVITAIASYTLWRTEQSERANEKIRQAQRRLIAREKRAIERMNQANHDRMMINERHARAVADLEELVRE